MLTVSSLDIASKPAQTQSMLSSTSCNINHPQSVHFIVPTKPRTKAQYELIGYYNKIGPSEGSEIWQIGPRK